MPGEEPPWSERLAWEAYAIVPLKQPVYSILIDRQLLVGVVVAKVDGCYRSRTGEPDSNDDGNS